MSTQFFTVIGKPGCRYCDLAMGRLALKGLNYRYVDLTQEPVTRDLLQRSGFKTVPQIWVEDGAGFTTHIGGFDELVKHVK